MSELLDQLPEAHALVHADVLPKGARADIGRKGMTAEQVLRCLLVKQLSEWSYEELAFHLVDSLSYRAFCRFGLDATTPKKATLQRNIKRVRAETLESVNQMIVEKAAELKVDSGRKVRTDCTVEETNIHEPSDSSLLWDSVRVLTRAMVHAKKMVDASVVDHRRRAKRRAIGIQHASRKAKRAELYRDLLKVADKTVRNAMLVAKALDKAKCRSISEVALVGALTYELRHYGELAHRVMDQTRRRVLKGESVPASEKIVSIFEPHTDIIRKDRRDTYYGHKVCLTSGASGMVLDCIVVQGNPRDSELAVTMMERLKQLYGRAPRQVSFDGGFASKANLRDIKQLGVKDVCFSKTSFLNVTDMVKSSWVYRRLRNFRAGVEGVISFLKRCFGLGRCTWRGFASFKAYTWASIVSHNLLVLARHALA
jgi:IS5 family transposase